MSESDTSLVPYEATYTAVEMVRPLVDPRTAKAAIAQYEALKAAIVVQSDIQRIQGRDFLKKAFWRRVATCFGLSLEMVSESRGFDEGGRLFYSVLYRAVAPNGRSMTADGYCSTAEAGRQGWPEHNVRATAHTRAKNRAISDLVGGGEVSAEEMPDENDDRPATPPMRKAPPAQTRTAAKAPSAEPVYTQPAHDGDARAKFAALRERARKAGITRDDDWVDVCEHEAGTADPLRMLPPGKRNLVRYIEAREAQQAEGDTEVTSADFPAPENDYDLSRLPTGAVRP